MISLFKGHHGWGQLFPRVNTTRPTLDSESLHKYGLRKALKHVVDTVYMQTAVVINRSRLLN